MQVNKMYHFHNDKVHNDVWVPNNEIIIDNSFETYFLNVLKYYSTAVKTTCGNKRPLNNIINMYLKEKQTEETLILFLREASNMIYWINIFKRELALEEIRKQKYPELPNWKHSIWLCDQKGIDFWEKELSNCGEI